MGPNPTIPTPPMSNAPLLRLFEEVGIGAIAEVGGKNASLGEMIRELTSQGVRVPGGFATTAAAYRLFLKCNGLEAPLRAILGQLDSGDLTALQQAGQRARELILGASLPPELVDAVAAAYAELGAGPVAVRSSATAEDLPDASFAGQQETFLNVRGETRSAGRLPALLQLPVHRSGHLLPPDQRLRSPGGGPLHRRAADGALRPGRRRSDVHDRHRNRLP